MDPETVVRCKERKKERWNMKVPLVFSFVMLCSLIKTPSMLAHHGYAAYDMTKAVTLVGTVTDFEMANPHSTISFDVKDEKGNVQHWGVEFGYIRALKQAGWANDTLKPGDAISITLHPAKNGANAGALEKVTYADGKPLPLTPPPTR
jgi:hypothetical protein